LTTPPTVTTTATTSSPAGTYPITASGAASPNYTMSYVDGTLTVTVAGGGPVANDNSYSTTKATALIVATPGVLGNDTGTGLTAVLVTGPSHGTLILNANGSFRYTPSSTYIGTDTFRYQAKDSSNTLSNIATVTITITQFSAAIIGPTTLTPVDAVANQDSMAVVARAAESRVIVSHDDPFRGQARQLADVTSAAPIMRGFTTHDRRVTVDQ